MRRERTNPTPQPLDNRTPAAQNLSGEAKPEDPRPVFIVRKVRRSDRSRAGAYPAEPQNLGPI